MYVNITKREIPKFCEKYFGSRMRFGSAHPMYKKIRELIKRMDYNTHMIYDMMNEDSCGESAYQYAKRLDHIRSQHFTGFKDLKEAVKYEYDHETYRKLLREYLVTGDPQQLYEFIKEYGMIDKRFSCYYCGGNTYLAVLCNKTVCVHNCTYGGDKFIPARKIQNFDDSKKEYMCKNYLYKHELDYLGRKLLYPFNDLIEGKFTRDVIEYVRYGDFIKFKQNNMIIIGEEVCKSSVFRFNYNYHLVVMRNLVIPPKKDVKPKVQQGRGRQNIQRRAVTTSRNVNPVRRIVTNSEHVFQRITNKIASVFLKL